MRSVKVARTSTRNAQFLPKRRARSSCQIDLQHTWDGKRGRLARYELTQARASPLARGSSLGSAPGPGASAASAANAPATHQRHQHQAAALTNRHGRTRATRGLTGSGRALMGPCSGIMNRRTDCAASTQNDRNGQSEGGVGANSHCEFDNCEMPNRNKYLELCKKRRRQSVRIHIASVLKHKFARMKGTANCGDH